MNYADNISQQTFDMLISKDFAPQALDAMGKPADAPNQADLFSFEFKTKNNNYGTVVILLNSNDMEVYYGDNLGKGMEREDRTIWYDFLQQVRMLAKRNMYTFSLNNMSQLKHNMATIAAVTEGALLEGYYGTRRTSYSDQPQKTKLVIKHSKAIGEGEARYRNIESIFVETESGERFRMPFKNLTASKAMARHIAEGGNPYDAFGQHIVDMVNEIGTLARFNRATRNQQFDKSAEELVEAAVDHYNALKRKVKKIIGRRGYQEEIENFDPITVTEVDETVNAVREIFVQQSLDNRIEEALPMLARLAVGSAVNSAINADVEETKMKELNEFESWADNLVEGTWTLPKNPDQLAKLNELMSEPLTVGVDATNATEQLYNIFGDDQLFDDLEELANEDPDADARPIIQQHLERFGIELEQKEVEEVKDIDTGDEVLKAERDPMLEDELESLLRLLK